MLHIYLKINLYQLLDYETWIEFVVLCWIRTYERLFSMR